MENLNEQYINAGVPDYESGQYVTFMIGEEIYGVDILRVHEIIGMTKITHIPNCMDYMKGMINLRGYVVPVVDMRIKFKMSERGYDEFTVILIVEVKEKLIGMITDTVSDVLKIPQTEIQDTSHFSTEIDSDYIMGIGKVEEKMVIMLDVDKILTSHDLDLIDNESD